MSARGITRVLLAFVALLSCAMATRASAHDELELTWPKIAGCPSQAQTLRRVEEQLGRPLSDVTDALQATVEIRRSALGYTLSLQTVHRQARGERTFQGARCEEVTDAAVLVLALSLGQAEQVRAAAPPQQPEPTPASKPQPKKPSGPAAPAPAAAAHGPSRPAPRRRSRVTLRAGSTLEGGFLPGVGIGAEIALSLGIAHSHGELAALWLSPKASDRRWDGSAVEVTLWAGRASYCHDLAGSRINRLAACGGVEIGRAYGRGLALSPSEVRSFLWSAGWLSIRLTSQLLPHFGLVLEPALGVPFTQHRFISTTPSDDRAIVLHTPKPTSKRVTFGAAIFF